MDFSFLGAITAFAQAVGGAPKTTPTPEILQHIKDLSFFWAALLVVLQTGLTIGGGIAMFVTMRRDILTLKNKDLETIKMAHKEDIQDVKSAIETDVESLKAIVNQKMDKGACVANHESYGKAIDRIAKCLEKYYEKMNEMSIRFGVLEGYIRGKSNDAEWLGNKRQKKDLLP